MPIDSILSRFKIKTKVLILVISFVTTISAVGLLSPGNDGVGKEVPAIGLKHHVRNSHRL